jgi:hypothetical protein
MGLDHEAHELVDLGDYLGDVSVGGNHLGCRPDSGPGWALWAGGTRSP